MTTKIVTHNFHSIKFNHEQLNKYKLTKSPKCKKLSSLEIKLTKNYLIIRLITVHEHFTNGTEVRTFE